MAVNRTANGVEIVEGLRVWDNNLRRVVVGKADRYDIGWYDMLTVEGGRSSMMNGDRMTTVHPSTGERA